MQKAVCLLGPTASGKTQLSIQLAERFPLEIISVDSALIYKHMDIGTAKPEKSILQLIPHHLIDICEPFENYSAAQFRKDALGLIQDICSRGKWPFLVGGTMLYFRALEFGLADLPEADEKVRAQLSQELNEYGLGFLHDKLKEVDPASGARIHPNDPQRIQRALEVFYTTGKPLSEIHHSQKNNDAHVNFLNIGLMPNDRGQLHSAIEHRFEIMLKEGFVDEVKKLIARTDLTLDKPSMRSVGYRQVWEYLHGEISFEQMKEKALAATRQLAKRQMTWLRHWPSDIFLFDNHDENLLAKIENKILEFL